MELIVRMTKQIPVLLILGAAAWFYTPTSAAAQSCIPHTDHAIYSMYDGRRFPPYTPTSYDCTYNGPWASQCANQGYQCPPQSPNVRPDCPNCSKPIALTTGNTYIDQIDIRVPGFSHGLTLIRAWNSRSAHVS